MKQINKFMWTAAGLFAVLGVIFLVSHLHHDNRYSFTCFITFLTCFYHFAYRLSVNAIFSKQLRKMNCKSKWFTVKNFEASLFKLFKVRRWKEKLPDLLPSVKSNSDFSSEELLRETCRTEIIHEINIVLSFVPFAASVAYGSHKWIFLLTGLITAVFDLGFVIFHRHFRTRLVKLTNAK